MPSLDLQIFTRGRVPLVRQTELAECGLACLTMIANYHGLQVDLGAMRRQFAPSLRGSSLRDLTTVADRMGMIPRAVKLPLARIGDLHLPAILHWGLNHFVVVERVKGNAALIHNPTGNTKWMPISEVSNFFTGVALELEPANDFVSIDRRERLRLGQLWGRIVGAKRAILQTIALSIVLEAFIVASPYYLQVAVDNALPAVDTSLLTVLAIGFGLFTLINAAAFLLRSQVLLVAGTVIGFNVSTNVARRLLRLPISWFERRHTGDVLSRFQSVLPIQRILTEGAVASLIDGSLALFTLALMFIYSVKLATVAVAAFSIYAAIRWFTFPLQREAQEASIVSRSKEQSTLIETLRGITTLRMFGRETLRHAFWQTRLADAVNADVRSGRLAIWQVTGSTLIFGLESVVSIWLALHAVINGLGFSLGMAFAFFAYKTQFIQKATSLIDEIAAFRMLTLHLERLSDIALSQEDRGFAVSSPRESQLFGKIELRGISFRYSPSDPLILNDLDFLVEPASHIAITGTSGGGKTTLVKIILGLIEPSYGMVLIDGVPIEHFGYRSYHQQVAAVLQEDTLFSGSLVENIALFDEAPDVERVTKAAMAAAIHNDIMSMPMQYETLVGDMGSSLSGGQKQRVLLARALYRQPRILVMDEGTAHLDAHHESAVNEAIRQLGVTRIVIAHREETLRAADRVLILRDGRLWCSSEEVRAA